MVRIRKAEKEWAFFGLGQTAAPARAKPVQRERAEQRMLKQWVDLQSWAPLWFHIANERQHQREAWGLKQDGVKPGLPDCVLWLPVGPYSFFACELKATKPHGKSASVEQMRVLEAMRACGAYVCVCFGADEAIAMHRRYAAGEL